MASREQQSHFLKSIRITLLVVCMSLALVCQSHLFAQQKELKFKHISAKDGLSQSSVLSIVQDRQGFMWFGTRTGGLNKYDGYSFTAFKHDPTDSCSISGNEITAVFEDSRGILWVGTRNAGLNRFDVTQNCFKKYSFTDLEKDNTASCFFEDSKGRMWIASNMGLWQYHYETDTFSKYLKSPKGSSSIVTSIAEAKGHQLWVGTKTLGLCLFDPEGETYKYFKHDPSDESSVGDDHIFSLLMDSKNRLWIGTRSKGISRLVDQEKGLFTHIKADPANPHSLSSNIIRTISEGKKGQIWVGTKLGLNQLTEGEQAKANPKFIHHTRNEYNENSLSQNSIYSFFSDYRNNFWVGTWGGGINYLNNDNFKFEHYQNQVNNKASLSNDVVSSFVQDGDDIWVGTEGGGLNLFNRNENTFTHYKYSTSEKNGLNNDHIKSLHIDQDGDFWVGTFDGLHHFDRNQNKFTLYLKGESVYSIVDGIEGELWVGTSKKLCRFDKATQKFNIYDSPSSAHLDRLASVSINTLFKDSKGRVWIGTKSGLHYYNRSNDNFVRFTHSDEVLHSISHSHVTSIAEDRLGNLWVGTYDGLNEFDAATEHFTLYGEKDGFPDNVINSLVMDDDDNLWVATNRGLSKLSLSILRARKEKQGDSPSSEASIFQQNEMVRNYDAADGLQGDEFIVGSRYKNADGELLFGGINGFNIFAPSKLKYNTHAPRVLITEFKLFNQATEVNTPDSPLKDHISQTKEITLDHTQSVFTLGFVALNYTSPEKNQYAYMMQGLDKDWNLIKDIREVTYTSLPAGDYIFRVKASNNDGLWNDEGVSLRITILPPWWDTNLFKAFIFLVIALAAFIFYSYRTNALKAQKKRLELEVKARTIKLNEAVAELEERQEEILQQTEEIRVQSDQLKDANTNLGKQKAEIEKSYNNANILSDFGQKLTSTLDIENISDMMYHYISSLMDISAFGIGIYDSNTQLIDFPHFIEGDKKLPSFTKELSNPNSLVSWCFSNQKAVYINDLEAEYKEYVPEKPEYSTAKPPTSNMHIPLSVEDKKIGVIAINSFKKNAYTENDFTLLKTVASYLAIALDNANAYRIIKSKNRNIENSIRYAQTIQEAILPAKWRLDKHLDTFLLYRPKDIVSGDFYWLSSLANSEQGDISYIAVVDCTGHGVPGAFMSIIGASFLNEIINMEQVTDLSVILDTLDTRIRTFLKQSQGRNDDGMDICLCKIEKHQGQTKITYSGAKRPLIVWDQSARKLNYIKGTNRAVGGGKQITKRDFETHEITLTPGSMVYLTSDGYTDQCNPNRTKFGTPQLLNVLGSIADKPLSEQDIAVTKILDDYQQTEDQRDDITIVGVKI